MTQTPCDGDCPRCLDAAVEQPQSEEWASADGIFVKSMALRGAGTLVPQHSHAYDHITMLALGAVRLWMDGELVGDFHAPCPIFIRAGTKHLFLTLEDETLAYCIHRVDRTGHVEIAAEHQAAEYQLVGA